MVNSNKVINILTLALEGKVKSSSIELLLNKCYDSNKCECTFKRECTKIYERLIDKGY